MKRSSVESLSSDIPTKRFIMSSQTPTKSMNLVNNRMKVNVRVRPFNEREDTVANKSTIDVVDNQMLVFDPIDDTQQYVYHGKKFKEIGRKAKKNLQFTFDRVFDDTITNLQVYEQSAKGFVTSLLNGYNCAVFAYGATGSGKTHTMLGSADEPGVIFFTTMDLFRQMQEKPSDDQLELSISYFEIYNEVVIDLLDPTSGKALAVREDGQRGVVVSNLSVHNPKDANHLLEMLEYGNKNRTQHPTDANAESSRSHAIFQISLKKQDFSSSQEMSIQISKMSLIDLAGSERATVAYKSNRSKGLQREGGNINKSLLALGNCITALASIDSTRKRSPHIPYRDSKLTLILRDSLGGNCQTAMIATISPSTVHIEETHNTLVYADRAKGIQISLKRNSFSVGLQPRHYNTVIESQNRKIAEQTEQYNALREENEKLRNIIDSAATNKIFANSDSNEKLNAMKNSLDLLFEERLELRRQLMECESNLRKVDLRLLFRKYDSERHKLMILNEDLDYNCTQKTDPLQALCNQKLHFSQQKTDVEESVKENEAKIKRIETELKGKTDENDWLIDTYFQNHNMTAEFRDKAFAERHEIDIAKEVLSRLESNEELMTESVKLNRHAYHCLNGMGRLSEELGNAFTALLRKVEGKKSVNWRDNISSPNLVKKREVENIFILPTYSALPKSPITDHNHTRNLVSVCSITPTYSFDSTPDKINLTNTALKPLNSIRNSMTYMKKSPKVAVVPFYNDNNNEDMLNGTFTVDDMSDNMSPRVRGNTAVYGNNYCNNNWRTTTRSVNNYTNNENKSNNHNTRYGQSRYRSGYTPTQRKNNYIHNRDAPYSSYRNNAFNSNRNRNNGTQSQNTKSPYNNLPRFRF